MWLNHDRSSINLIKYIKVKFIHQVSLFFWFCYLVERICSFISFIGKNSQRPLWQVCTIHQKSCDVTSWQHHFYPAVPSLSYCSLLVFTLGFSQEPHTVLIPEFGSARNLLVTFHFLGMDFSEFLALHSLLIVVMVVYIHQPRVSDFRTCSLDGVRRRRKNSLSWYFPARDSPSFSNISRHAILFQIHLYYHIG